MQDSVRAQGRRREATNGGPVMPRLRTIFGAIVSEKPPPLPHVAVYHGEGAVEKRGRAGDGHAGTVRLQGRVAPEVLAQARLIARTAGITVQAYLAAQIMRQPPSADGNGMTDAFLERVAASPVILTLDKIDRTIREGHTCDLDSMIAELRAIASAIGADCPMTGEPSAQEEGGTMLSVRLSPPTAARARKEAQQFGSVSAYLSALVQYPRQAVAPAEANVLARTLPLTICSSRVASAIAAVLQRVAAGDDRIGALIPELRAVQRALSDRIVAGRAAYDALIDDRHGARDDIEWSAGFLEEQDESWDGGVSEDDEDET
jgi:hypothetical protein